jgi:hypothetical protein
MHFTVWAFKAHESFRCFSSASRAVICEKKLINFMKFNLVITKLNFDFNYFNLKTPTTENPLMTSPVYNDTSENRNLKYLS